MLLARDRHFYPIIIPAGATIRIKTTDVALVPGTYWAHDDATLNATHPSFYMHLRARLTAVYGWAWTVAPVTLPGYSMASGLQLTVVPGSGTETINFDFTTPIVKQLLGFPATKTGTVALTGNTVISEQAVIGSWSPSSMIDGRAASKDSMKEQINSWSSEHPEVAKAIVWRNRKLRLCIYPLVYGATVLGSRSQVTELAAQAGVALNDDHNALDRLWQAAGLDIGDVLVSHDATSIDFQIATRRYDVAKIATRAAAADLGVIASRNNLASDLYDVRLPYTIIGGDYGL